jgi:hypothetical protein
LSTPFFLLYLYMEKYISITLSPTYFISNLGNVKNSRGTILKQTTCKKGYKKISIGNPRKSYKVHRLVALMFIENELNKSQVNHINGIKNDNRVENLEWMTNQENCIHAWQNGFKENQRILLSNLKKKIVLDLQTGIFYDSIQEYTKIKNVPLSSFYYKLKNNNTNNIFTYI